MTVRALAVACALVCVVPATAGATFPGTNGKIAITRVVDSDIAVWTVNPDGSDLRRLAGGGSGGTSWSPDGTRIAFSNSDAQPTVVNADGSGLTPVPVDTQHTNGHVAWSADGTRLVYTALTSDAPTLDLFSVSLGGSGGTQLTFNDPAERGQSTFPGISPDGRTIAYLQASPGEPIGAIWLMNAAQRCASACATRHRP